MSSESNTTASRLSLRARICVSVIVLAGLVSTIVYLSRTPAVQADDPAASVAAATPREPTTEFFPAQSKAEETILAALAKPTTMDFQSTPLEKAVAYLKDLHEIEIQLDNKALEDSGANAATPVDGKLSGLSLRSALRLVIGRHDLTSIIKDEVLLITTKEVAEAELVTRTYPCADLADDGDYDRLVDAITKTVKPQSWDEVGGPGSISVVESCGSLVISQTQDMHDEILQLLRALRAARKASGVIGVAHKKAPGEKTSSHRRAARRGKTAGGMMGGGMGGMGGGMGGGMMGGMGGGQTCQGSTAGGKAKTDGKATKGGGMFSVADTDDSCPGR